MEKPLGKKRSIFSLVITKTGAICFTSFPHCPGHEKPRPNTNTPKVSTGKRSTKSLIPQEARTRPSFKHKEPVSPKVSCLGEVKHKKRIGKADKCNNPTSQNAKKAVQPFPVGFYLGGDSNGLEEEVGEEKEMRMEHVPTLGQMKQFSSGRNTLGNFKWNNDEGCNEEREERRVESEPVSPCSLSWKEKPKKEVNLWKRRSMDNPPGPLQLNGLRN